MTDLQQLLDMASTRVSAYSGYRCAFASGSLVEGYGNPTSDLDVFVVWPDADSSAAAPRTVIVDGIGIELNFDQALKIDIEHWSDDNVKALAAQISDTPPLDFERVEMITDLGIQFAHRLRVGAYVALPASSRRCLPGNSSIGTARWSRSSSPSSCAWRSWSGLGCSTGSARSPLPS